MMYTFNGWEFGFNDLIDLKSCQFASFAEAMAFGEKLKELLDDDHAVPGYMIDENDNGYDFGSNTRIVNGEDVNDNYGLI